MSRQDGRIGGGGGILTKTITLRDEVKGRDRRTLWAYVDERGLHIDGQDLGPGTASVSPDGEYEWSYTYAPEAVLAVIRALDGAPGENVMTVLQRWVGRSYELEARLTEAGIPRTLTVA